MTRAILFTVLTWTFLLACKEQRTSSIFTTATTLPPDYETPVPPELITEIPTNVTPPEFQQDEYLSGFYCAMVKFYNPSYGTICYYDLTVEVDNGRMVNIYFPNSGWPDDTNFEPHSVDNDDN